jgi:hypothetical protein
VKEYLLNQSQVLLIAMLGRTAESRALRAHMIAVYNDWHAQGMQTRIATSSFWEDERRRLELVRHRATEAMRLAEPGLKAEEARLRAALDEFVERRDKASAIIAGHDHDLAAMGEAGPMSLSSFRQDLGALSDRACVFHVVASGLVDHLSTHVMRIFARRLSKREMDDALKALTAMDIAETEEGAWTVVSFADA